MTSAEKIKKLRTSKGITLRSLAKKIGVSAACISRYETGSRVPQLLEISKVAKGLEVSPVDILPDWFITEMNGGK